MMRNIEVEGSVGGKGVDERQEIMKIKGEFQVLLESVIMESHPLLKTSKKKQLKQSQTIQKYNILVQKCYEKYQQFMQHLLHNQTNNHLPEYFRQLHQNSTTMKQNLLALLKDERKINQIYQQTINAQQIKIKENQELVNLLREKQKRGDDELFEVSRGLEETREIVRGLESALEEAGKQINKLKEELGQKEMELLALKESNEQIILSAQKASRIGRQKWNKQNFPSSRELKRAKTTVRICGQKSRKLINDKEEKIIPEWVNQDLCRLLLTQAVAIQDLLLNEQTSEA